jgi:hypothetical protein
VKVGNRRQAVLLVILVLALVFFAVRWSSKGSQPSAGGAPRPAASTGISVEDEGPPRGGRRPAARQVSPDEVPVLQPSDLDPSGGPSDVGTGRDLFDFRVPTPTPLPVPTPPPPPPPGPGDPRFVGPLPPPPPSPTPVPPEVPFRFIGTFGPKEQPIAVLINGDQIVNARAGDVVFGQFILRKIGYESIVVGFVGFAPSETRTLGITP